MGRPENVKNAVDAFVKEIVNGIELDCNAGRNFEHLLAAYNRYQEDERDGVDYIFDINRKEDLNCCIEGGMTAREIADIIQSKHEYFFFGQNHPNAVCLGFEGIFSQVKSIASDFANKIVRYPYVEEYKELYFDYIVQWLD